MIYSITSLMQMFHRKETFGASNVQQFTSSYIYIVFQFLEL